MYHNKYMKKEQEEAINKNELIIIIRGKK